MEPVEAEVKRLKINWVVTTKVTAVTEHHERVYVGGFGETTEFKEISKGWYVTFEGSHESIFFGSDRPPFEKGDKVKITFQKEQP